MLAISNDYPEFLIENHYELMNALPQTYFQLKNVILSAIPRGISIPNPFDQNVHMKDMPECQTVPNVYYDPVADLRNLKKPVDNYLRIPSSSLLRTVVNGLYSDEKHRKNCLGYEAVSVNQKLIRAIVLHTGIEAGLENEKTSSNAIFNTKSSYYTLLFEIIKEGKAEIKYQMIQSIIEQLRYPNIHTYWFSFVIKEMFISKEWDDQLDIVRELILRVLLERLIVNKPHTWGVTMMMHTLITNKDVEILELECVKSQSEVQLIFKQLIKHANAMSVATPLNDVDLNSQTQPQPINA